MKSTITPRGLTAALSLIFLSSISAKAALTLNFTPIPGSISEASNVKLEAVVDFYGPNGVSITFNYHPTSITANVHEFYFEDTAVLLNGMGAVFSTVSVNGVVYTSPATPAHLPGATFTATFGYDSSPSANGLTLNESITFHFDGTDFANLAAVENAFATNQIRLGAHIGSIGTSGNSASFIAVPEPTAAALGLIGTLLLLRRKRM